MSFGLGPKAPKARHSVAAAVRPWIKKPRNEIEARRAGISLRCDTVLMPRLRRLTI